MIIAATGGGAPGTTGPLGACPFNRIPFVSRAEPAATDSQLTAAAAHGLGVLL